MLEVKDLVKVYKTKGGAEVRALDGVSLRFEEKAWYFCSDEAEAANQRSSTCAADWIRPTAER